MGPRDHEPIWFQFGSDLRTQGSTKFSFTRFWVWFQIRKLLRAVRPLFDEFEAHDEIGLWKP